MNKKKFKGLCEDTFWLPLTQILIDASNTAMQMYDGDDLMYTKWMALQHDLLVPLYVDTKSIDINTFNRLFQIFIYVLEFVYGDPYSQENKKFEHYITTQEYFDNIKKHWNDDIEAKVRQVEAKINKAS